MNSDVLKMFRQHWPLFLCLLDFRLIRMPEFSKSRGFRIEMEGGDDNSIRPVTCQSGKISVFLEHIFIF